jgi:hypothetical protein
MIGVVSILVVLITLIVPATSAMAAPTNGQCTKRMLLHPVIDSCRAGEQHCYHLIGTTALKDKDLKRYLIVDVKTGETHTEKEWRFQGNVREKHATFGVPTTYAWTHPLWPNGIGHKLS